MKNIVKDFFLRGLMCSGFGSLVYGIVMFILYLCKVDTSIDGLVLFKGIISTYIIAFLIAGMSAIWQVDKIGLAISILVHGFTLYFCYLFTYLVNGWLSKNALDLVVFSLIFIGRYLLIWLIIYIVEKNRATYLNSKLKS